MFTHFVPYQMEGYPRITKFTLVVLLLFVTAYLCEHAFSERVVDKTPNERDFLVKRKWDFSF